ncbi:integrase [Pseudomonas sp. FW215-R2]|jgi:integrase|uniref:tyrosine-type recombinase/integrase n=1 Tax=unclassified Pseudomonas TaxID=196821 RepID=UPI000C88CC8C|nr:MULTISPECIES: site-specific integrase [unclassified Pseudomonas]PMX02347.1 integrase [Pseudomonas sp. FW215-R2]PMX11033.1 integrase [Pseudomonas sp. FW215-L1]PMX20782.1 integrase [Pseudomonas sp. FW215-E1]PNA21739.1 integrase [Pseudomonas sp. FW215-R4]
MSTDTASSYQKIKLRNFRFFEVCEPSVAMDWEGGIETDNVSLPAYPITAWPYTASHIPFFHIILDPDQQIWVLGNLYLLDKVAGNKPVKHQSEENIASDLAHFMTVLHNADKDWLTFGMRTHERPTYFYRAELEILVATDAIKWATAKRKMSSAIGIYRWMKRERNFTPRFQMWKEEKIQIRYTDKFGFPSTKEVITTDLSFKRPPEHARAFIQDGGKLRPLDLQEQELLIDALYRLDNIEMLFIFILALTTGMRIQTILTLREHCIDMLAKDEGRLIKISVGDGTLVDTKNQTHQDVLCPDWVHAKLAAYLASPKYQARKDRACSKPKGEQYIFLTRTGKPYYLANSDKSDTRYTAAENGSAIRAFIKDRILPLINEASEGFQFSFHDLRATFGMNLIEEKTKDIDEGKINMVDLLDYVRKRLNHTSVETTMSYLNFRRNEQEIAQAQTDFEVHLKGLLDDRRFSDDQARKHPDDK